jgi:PST family polysaccharide transporter
MSLAESTARGAVWTIATSMGGRFIGVLGTVVMTRFLAPEVVGEISAATIIVMTAGWLITWGFGPYVVVKGRGPEAAEVVWHATVAYVGLGVLVFVPLAFLGEHFTPLVGAINAINAAEYIPGMALVFFMKRVTAIPERILVRDMRFRALGLANATGELVYTGVALGCAARGWGGMSVVIGNLAQTAVNGALILRATGFASWATPSRLSAKRFVDMLRFGVPLAIEGIAHNASRYWDNLFISGYFGTGALGTYNMAYNLADIPAVQIGEQISSVLLPSMVTMPAERRPAALERSTALLSLIIFPMAAGLGLVADPLIAVVLPADKWQRVAPLLTVLATLSVFRPLTWVLSTYMEAQNRTARMMFLEVGKLALILGGIVVLAPYGVVVAAGAVGFAFGVSAVLGVVMVVVDDRQHGPSPRRLLLGFAQPLLACAAMAAAVLVLRFQVLQGSGLPAIATLLIEVVVGGLVYVATALVVCRTTAKDLLSMLSKISKRQRPASE